MTKEEAVKQMQEIMKHHRIVLTTSNDRDCPFYADTIGVEKINIPEGPGSSDIESEEIVFNFFKKSKR